MNDGYISTTGNPVSSIFEVSGVSIGSGAKFINTGEVDTEAYNIFGNGLKILNGGDLINEGTIDINASSGARGISISGMSEMDLIAGIINIHLKNANAIKFFLGTLTINSGAELNVSGTPQDYLMDIDSAAILDCNGILELKN